VDDAIQWIEDRILQDFFKSSLQPAPYQDLLKRAMDAATALGAATLQDALKDSTLAGKLAKQLGVSPDALNRIGQTGGAGGLRSGGSGAGGNSTFSLQLQFTFRDIKQEELKTIEFDWREARAEMRTAAPQGLLSGFGARPRIVEAQDSGTFWDSINVTVRPLGDFAALGVQLMSVQLAYPDENAPTRQKACVFQPGQMAPQPFSAWTNGQPPRYRVRTEVHFDEQGPWPGPPTFIGDWHTSESLDLAVHPLSETQRIELDIGPGQIAFAETPQAQVDVRIAETSLGTCMMTSGAPTASFRRRLPTGTTPSIEARITWFLAAGPRVEGDWSAVEGTTLLVHRPWRSTRSLRLLPLLPADFLDASVALTSSEGAHVERVDVRFDPGDRRAKQVDIPSLFEQPPPVRIQAMVIRGDGSTFNGQPFETTNPVVLIRDRDGDFRQISVRLLAGPTLAGHGLMAVQVQLLDASDQPTDHVVFTESQRASGLLLVPADADPPPRYRVIRYALNGVSTMSAPQGITGTEVLVPAVVQS
jgi:hypothetical protein